MKSFLITNNKWITLVAGVLVTVCSGTMMLFSVYFPYVKSTLHYHQSEMDFASSMGNSASWFNVFTGLFLDRYGARITGIMSSFLLFFGYFMIWITLEEWIVVNYYVFGLFVIVLGIGSMASYSAAFAPNLINFDTYKGRVVGLMGSFFGLSSTFFTLIYIAFFKPDIPGFLLFLAIFASALLMGSSFFLNVYIPRHLSMINNAYGEQSIQEESKIYIDSEEIDEKEKEINRPLLTTESFENNNLEENETDDSYDDDPVLLKKKKTPYHLVQSLVGSCWFQKPTQLGKDHNAIQMMRTVEFWIFFLQMLCACGSQYFIINQIGNMADSFNNNGAQDTYVIVMSVNIFLATVIVGFGSDYLASKVNRPLWFVGSVVLTALTLLFLAAFANALTLYIAAGAIGFANGATWSVVPSMISELWGRKHWGANFALINISPGIGSYLFSTLLSGRVYDSHTDSSGIHCEGIKCFQLTYLVCGILCATMVLLGFLLVWRTRQVYRKEWRRISVINSRIFD